MDNTIKPRQLPDIRKRTKINASQLVHMEQLDLKFANGEERIYERIYTSGLGAVIVVPFITPTEVLLVREYAAGVNRYEISLPKGRLEKDESAIVGANRELQEETGYAAKHLTELGGLTLAPGYMSHTTQIIVAQDLYPSKLEGDEPEKIDVIRWPLSEIIALTQRDDFSEGRSMAALFLAKELLTQGKLEN